MFGTCSLYKFYLGAFTAISILANVPFLASKSHFCNHCDQHCKLVHSYHEEYQDSRMFVLVIFCYTNYLLILISCWVSRP